MLNSSWKCILHLYIALGTNYGQKFVKIVDQPVCTGNGIVSTLLLPSLVATFASCPVVQLCS